MLASHTGLPYRHPLAATDAGSGAPTHLVRGPSCAALRGIDDSMFPVLIGQDEKRRLQEVAVWCLLQLRQDMGQTRNPETVDLNSARGH